MSSFRTIDTGKVAYTYEVAPVRPGVSSYTRTTKKGEFLQYRVNARDRTCGCRATNPCKHVDDLIKSKYWYTGTFKYAGTQVRWHSSTLALKYAGT